MRILTLVTVMLAWIAPPAASQDEEDRPFFERFVYGGVVLGNLSPVDHGYFNTLDYEQNLMRLIRFNFAVELRASERVGVLTEIRSDNFDVPEPYALFVRFRPWRERAFDIQAGRIPPVFGAFARRRYDTDNPLIGYPLLYQYPNTLRSDSLPQDLTDVLERRGYGAKVSYSVGNQEPHSGLPVMNPLRWDTGVQVKIGRDPAELAVALTQGTISRPRVSDENAGKQIAARIGLRPAFGWTVGLSGARGEYVADEVGELVGEGGHQSAIGADLEFARDHFLLRSETMWSQWETPTLRAGALDVLGFLLETRYKLSPGLYVAGRVGRLSFAEVAAPDGGTTWDASVWRIELGGGYYFHRRLLAKASLQYNSRGAGPLTTRAIPAMQLLFWF